jgi:TRAP-type C4-dicarboxylate transport system substrate-binding protein
LLWTVAATNVARADVTLRMAAIAPEGTAWAREVRAFAREVETLTQSQVRMKWYLGGIAGDELTALMRVHHGQLDGLAGASFCERLAPSLRVMRVVGLFENRDEVAYVLGRLKPMLDEEFRKSGFADLALSVFGFDMLFSRRPVASMADFRATRWWMWSLSPIYQAIMPAIGGRMVVTPLDQLGPAYVGGQFDGFIVPPSVALAFQLSTLASYYTPLETWTLPGCLILSNSAMDPLPLHHQEAIRAAAAKFRMRWNDVIATLEQTLVDGLFEKQGMKKVAVTPQFRAEYFEAVREARGKLSDQLAPRALVARVEKLLQDYRAELLQ